MCTKVGVGTYERVWIIWSVGCFPALDLFICICVHACVCVRLRRLLGFASQGIVGILRGLFVNINSSKFDFIVALFLRHYSQMAAKAHKLLFF